MSRALVETGVWITLVMGCFGCVAGCNSDGPPTPPGGDPDGGTLDWGVPEILITTDTIWRAEDNPHIVTGKVIVAGPADPRLTIEPGVIVRFAAGAGLVIGTAAAPGSLRAVGTEALPIQFSSDTANPSPGDWRGLIFAFDSVRSEVRHATFAHCGQPSGWSSSCVTVIGDPTKTEADCQPEIPMWLCTGALFDHVTVRQSSGYGFDFLDGGQFGFLVDADTGPYGPTTIRIEECGDYPIAIGPNGLRSIPYDTILAGNSADAILVRGGELYRQLALNPTEQRYPTVVESDIVILAYTIVNPGAVLRFRADAGLIVGSATRAGTLSVGSGPAGTPLFTADSPTPSPGSWKGIVVAEMGELRVSATETNLRGAIVEYAGSPNVYSDAAITVVDGDGFEPLGLTVRKNAHDGVLITGEDSPVRGGIAFRYFTATDNGGHAVSFPAHRIGDMLFHHNTTPPMITGTGATIRIFGGQLTQPGLGDINSTAQFPRVNVPVVIDGDVIVAGPLAPLLSINGGVLRFRPGTRLQIGSASEGGQLAAAGTTFTADSPTPTPGFWKGITIYHDAGRPNSLVDSSTIEYGGQLDGSMQANLTFVGDSAGTLSPLRSSTIRHSAGCGVLRVDDGSGFTTNFTDPMYGNTFTGNAGGNQCGP